MYPQCISHIAEVAGITPEQAGEAVDQYWWAVRFSMENDTMPTIRIDGLGRLRPGIGQLGRSLKNTLLSIRGNSYLIVAHKKESMKVRFSRVWEVCRRMHAESRRRIHKGSKPSAQLTKTWKNRFTDNTPPTHMGWWRALTQTRRTYRSHINNPGGTWEGEENTRRNAKEARKIRALLDKIKNNEEYGKQD